MVSVIREQNLSLAPETAEAKRAAGQTADQEPQSAGASNPSAKQFISPVTRVDTQTGLVLLQYRDGDTGEVENQIPREKVVREYQLHGSPDEAQAVAAPKPAEASQSPSTDTPSGGQGEFQATQAPGTAANVAAE